MDSTASDLSQRLAQRAEDVCRAYLSKGRREGRYWLVGDVQNTPGRSLYVRLEGPASGPGAAGHWRDAATGQHGDLLDLIGLALDHDRLVETFDEARRFLALPPVLQHDDRPRPGPSQPRSPARAERAARRLFGLAGPLSGSLGDTYLQARGLAPLASWSPLRFHPHCYYRPARTDAPETLQAWPALIARVDDLSGRQTGAHRTWLDPTGATKAPIATPRRAIGALLGHGVRFGVARDVLAAGEGLETVLSLAAIAPRLPLVAALSSAHLAALLLPPGLERLYVIVDPDPAGRSAAIALAQRAQACGIQARSLLVEPHDLNDGLRRLGPAGLLAQLRPLFAPQDAETFLRQDV